MRNRQLDRLFLCLCVFALGAPALAQTPEAKPAAKEEAKDKPWRLGDALGAPGWLHISGSIRPRYETLANQFVAGRTGDDEFLSLQTLLKIEIDTGGIVLGGELADARRLAGNGGGGVPAEINTLEPNQLYLAWRPKNFLMDGASLDLTVGRFNMDAGSRRLIARSNYRNIFQSFDGAHAVWTGPGGIQATGFVTTLVNRAPADAPSALDNEVAFDPNAGKVRFDGLMLDAPIGWDVIAEAYLFKLDESDASDAPTRNRDLSTAGVRFKRAPKTGQFDFEAEYAHQTGTVRATTSAADATDLDHDASMLHLEGGWTFDAPWSPRLSLQLDDISGDKSPTDLKSERFDSLFGDRTFEYGPTGIYGAVARTNMDSVTLRLEVKPSKISDAYVAVRQVRLDEARDSFANSNVRDATGASGRDVGMQVDVRYRRWLVQDSVRLSIGGAALIRDDFLKNAPNATRQGDSYFGFTDVTFSF